MTSQTTQNTFDTAAYKRTTRDQWDAAAEAWHKWGPTLRSWLGPASERMLDMAGVASRCRVRVGPCGSVLPTDISPASFTQSITGAICADLSK